MTQYHRDNSPFLRRIVHMGGGPLVPFPCLDRNKSTKNLLHKTKPPEIHMKPNTQRSRFLRQLESKLIRYTLTKFYISSGITPKMGLDDPLGLIHSSVLGHL